MKKHIAIVALAGLLLGCGAAKPMIDDSASKNPIVTALDLTKVDNDRVPVVINPGRFKTETVTYRLPKVVQGTYSVGDYGRFIDDFKALDYNGNALDMLERLIDLVWRSVRYFFIISSMVSQFGSECIPQPKSTSFSSLL